MNTIRPRNKMLEILLASTLLSTAAFAQNVISAHPGTVNYVEGQVSLEGRQITPKSIGQTTLQAGQYLATANGKAEILLTPGVFLRLGSDTTIKMVAPDLTHTEIQLEQGRATIEVDQLYKQNRILIDQHGGQTQVLQNGLYEFDANASTVRVFQGKAAVYPGSDFSSNIKPIDVKADRQLSLAGGTVKTQKFDRNATQAGDSLYAWSDLRSNYLGQANLTLADQYAGAPGFGYGYGFNPGWYWASGLYGYTWLPGDGLFWSPFGYGFYSPFYLYGGGVIYGGGYGYGGHPIGRPAPHSGGYGYRGGAEGYHGGAVAAPHASVGFSGGGGGGGGGRR